MRAFVEQSKLFEMAEADSGNDRGANWFRLTGRGLYGFSIDEMVQDLRIDVDGLNIMLADAVNVR